MKVQILVEMTSREIGIIRNAITFYVANARAVDENYKSDAEKISDELFKSLTGG